MKWAVVQDEQITDALASLDRVFDDRSPVRRLWALTSDFIGDKHVLNVHAVKRRHDTFSVIDIGCGTGDLLARLAAQFPEATFTGVDPNRPSIGRAHARHVPRCTFVCGPFEQAAGRYDIVICSEVLEHVEDADRLLDGLRDLVTPGGYLSISTPSGWMYRVPRLYNAYKVLRSPKRFWRLYLRPEHHWSDAVRMHPAIQPAKLRRRLEDRGFSLVLRQSALWWFQEPGATERLFHWWGCRRAALMFFHLNVLADAAMNLLPVLRVGETRAVLLMERR